MLSATSSNSRGWSESRGLQKSYQVKGTRGAFSNSDSVTKSSRFYSSVEGLLTIKTAGCSLYKAS